MHLRLAGMALTAVITLVAASSAFAQAGGVGAGPTNSKSAITGQSGTKGVEGTQISRARMARPRMKRRHR